MKARSSLLLALLLVAVGCNSGETTAKKGDKPEGTGAETTATTGGSTPPAAPDLAQIPESLKGEAFEYYGLANTKPMNMAVENSDQPTAVSTGTQTIALKEIKDGVPTFSIERTGQLAALGSQEVRLEADGIYNSMSTVAKLGPKDLELPMKLSPGTKWKSHAEITQNGQTIVNDSELTVVGPEKVKTKAGEHDALLITSTGLSTINGEKAKTTSKNWYVKGLGNVKSVLTLTFPKKVTTLTIQEIP